jgi:hypothetical protein
MIIESNSGIDLSPFLMVGEMERRIASFYSNLSVCQRYLLLSNGYYLFHTFELLPKEIRKSIINKLT